MHLKYEKGALDHGWWFSPGTPASSTTKTGRHDIAEILLKVASNTKIQIQDIGIHTAVRTIFIRWSITVHAWLVDWCLTPTLAVFQLYCGCLCEKFLPPGLCFRQIFPNCSMYSYILNLNFGVWIVRTIIHLFSVSDSYVSCDIVRRYLFSHLNYNIYVSIYFRSTASILRRHVTSVFITVLLRMTRNEGDIWIFISIPMIKHTTNIVSHWSNKRLFHIPNRGIIHWCFKRTFVTSVNYTSIRNVE
jgi:hypothetical protein